MCIFQWMTSLVIPLHILFRILLDFISDSSQPLWFGVTLSVIMFVCACVQSLLQQQAMSRMFVFGMRLKTVLTATIYRKVRSFSKGVLYLWEGSNRLFVTGFTIVQYRSPRIYCWWNCQPHGGRCPTFYRCVAMDTNAMVDTSSSELEITV